jgi:hypothetical protein
MSNITLYTGVHKNGLVIEPLYSIEYTKAGPIIRLLMSAKAALNNTFEYERVKAESGLTFNEAKNIVVEWFLSRATTIEAMSRMTYFGTDLLDEDRFTQFIGEYVDSKHPTVDSDLAGGRA